MRFQSGEGFGGSHVRNEAQVEFGDCFFREESFFRRGRIAADEAFDVHGGSRHQEFERFLPTDVVHPVLDAEKFLGFASLKRRAASAIIFFSAAEMGAPSRRSLR